MDRTQAAEEFVKFVHRVGVSQTIIEMHDMIQEPVGADKRQKEAVGQWFNTLSDGAQDNVRFLIKEAIVMSLFSLLVNLDGDAAFHYTGEKPVDFGLTMNVYADVEEAFNNKPEEQITILPSERGDNLHDLFMYEVESSH